MRISVPPGSPAWALQLGEQINRAFLELAWPRVKTVAAAADRPAAAGNEGRLLYNQDTDSIVVSDGANWDALGGSGVDTTPWTAYTPTLTSLSGGFTSASATGRYKQIGRTVFAIVDIRIPDVGTGQYPRFTLPVAPVVKTVETAMFHGRDGGVGGHSNCGSFHPPTGTVQVTRYDNANPAASGSILTLTGVYEAA